MEIGAAMCHLVRGPTNGTDEGIDEGIDMGLLDKAEGLLGDNKDAVKGAVDKAADLVESKTPDQVDGAVEKGADEVKNLLDKLGD